jgi:segregation and condensation protein A
MSEHHDLFPSNDDAQSVSDRLSAEALIVDVDGFEGPLDLLLTLSRTQKVDLMRISILELAQQYLDFVERAKALRIELAADYLVMAAWLAFLKSRLLLPPDPADEGPSGEEMAAHLAFQLERLQAMRDCAARLMARDQKGRDFFVRGIPENVETVRTVHYTANLLDLMQAYSRIRTRGRISPLCHGSQRYFYDGRGVGTYAWINRLCRRLGRYLKLSARWMGRITHAPSRRNRIDICSLA